MSIRTSFRQIRKFLGPRWLTSGEGGLIGYALDLIKDAFVHRAYLGLLSGMPTTAPPDMRVKMGRDRRVVRGIFEDEASYTARLIRWLDDRVTQGNPKTLLNRLAEYLGPGVLLRIVDNRGNWYTRNLDGTFTLNLKSGNWDWDSAQIDDSAARWSRFWIIIYPSVALGWNVDGPGWNEGGAWGASSYATWGSSAPSEHVQTVRAIAADWKRKRSRCVNIIVAFDPDSFDPSSPEPDGMWHRNGKTVGGHHSAARLDTARYWDGV